MHKTETGWKNITTSLDTDANTICGIATGFSWFIVVEPAPIADAGPDQTFNQESCDGAEIALDGSGSKAPYSTPGTNDDIVSFDWYEADTLLVSGEAVDLIFPLGEYSLTLVVTDSSGITDDDMVTIIVRDAVPPIVDAGPSITVEKETHVGTQVTLTGSALDNCDAELDYEWSENSVVYGNDATLTHTFSLGSHTLTLKATDNFDNVGTSIVTVTVVDDTTPPTITCPDDVILECPADTSVAANGSATALDNYDSSPTIMSSDASTSGCGNTEVITRTWTATDVSGNSSSCVQIITVQDTTPPTFITIPEDVNVMRDGNGNQSELDSWLASLVEAEDTCGDVNI
jgi:hypothetical protein